MEPIPDTAAAAKNVSVDSRGPAGKPTTTIMMAREHSNTMTQKSTSGSHADSKRLGVPSPKGVSVVTPFPYCPGACAEKV